MMMQEAVKKSSSGEIITCEYYTHPFASAKTNTRGIHEPIATTPIWEEKLNLVP
jgi:hypothetical protein